MAISGSLEDVELADVLRFIALGRRTGTLELAPGEEQARLGFVEGALVSAQAPGARRLGDLLLAAQKVGLPALQRAVALQASGGGAHSLGQAGQEGGAQGAPGSLLSSSRSANRQCRRGPGRCRGAGPQVRRARVPWPGALSRVRDQPKCSARRRAMERPRPVPPAPAARPR